MWNSCRDGIRGERPMKGSMQMPVKTERVAEDAGSHDLAALKGAEPADMRVAGEGEPPEPTPGPKGRRRRPGWARLVAFAVLPGLALLLALGAGFLKWQDSSVRDAEVARIESVQAAKDGTVALLSYRPDSVDKDLGAARDRLTGNFRDSYTSLTNDVVIPGAKQKQISAVATVPAAASVSAKEGQAVVLVFVNQTNTIGNDAPTDTASTVKVTLDKVGGRWLIAGFDPI
jgi:Mce-associated membrane protein